MIIGFCGSIGSGKTTAAQFLIEDKGFVRVRFAQPFKSMLLAIGLTHEEVDGHLKEKPCDLLGGKTPRYAMQMLGTEWGRDLISPQLWVNCWKKAAADQKNVVVDDVRFHNEVTAIHQLGGKVIRIIRSGAGTTVSELVNKHASEQADLHEDFTILNDGATGVLMARVNRYASALI